MTCSFSSPDSSCRLDGIGSMIISLLACDLDMTPHLIALGVSSSRLRVTARGDAGTVSEVELILNRAGTFVVTEETKSSMTICPTHRKKLTSDWAGRKSSTCSYPTHRGPRKSMKNVRRANVIMSAEIHQIYQAAVPRGSGW